MFRGATRGVLVLLVLPFVVAVAAIFAGCDASATLPPPDPWLVLVPHDSTSLLSEPRIAAVVTAACCPPSSERMTLSPTGAGLEASPGVPGDVYLLIEPSMWRSYDRACGLVVPP